ncbi:MAG: hypothetical protein IJY26_00990 [Clostridia bacterium]|nr:hypothetical protein [Clostridia bacterium]
MNTFKLKFKNYIVALSYVGVAVCAVVLASTVWRCIDNGGFTGFYDTAQYLILFLVSVFAAVLLLCVIHNSKYIITDTEFITSFGFIKSKFLIADMTEAVFNKNTCQLAIYTGENFMVFRLNEQWSKEFISLLLSKNKKILYNETEDFEADEKKKDTDDKAQNDKKDENKK